MYPSVLLLSVFFHSIFIVSFTDFVDNLFSVYFLDGDAGVHIL